MKRVTTTFIELFINESSDTRIVAIECHGERIEDILNKRYKHLSRWKSLQDGRAIAAIHQVDKPLLEAKAWLLNVLKGN